MGERRSIAVGILVFLLGVIGSTTALAQQGEDPFAAEEDPFAEEEAEPAESADPNAQSGEALPPPTVPDGYGNQPQAQPAPAATGNQPGYGQQQPAYAQPAYPQQQYQRPPRLQRIPYHEGMTVPEGGRLIEKRSLGLIIAGGAMFLVTYGLSVSFYADSSLSGLMLVPVLGPIIETRNDDLFAIDRFLLVLDGLVQAAGLTLFGLGIGRKKKFIEFYGMNEPGWRVTPRVGIGGGGIDLRARF
ncbi:MAG: hypothetical protein JJ863_07480 [Deltaproteobacteria bacterium]|nr:hypothetical protein [Deltaproteobacteria bacterium]